MMHLPSRDQLRNLADFLLPILLMAAILIATSLFGYARMNDALLDIERDTHHRLDQVAEVIAFSELLDRSRTELRGIVAARQGAPRDPATRARDALRLDNRLAELESRFDAIGAWTSDPEAHARASGNLKAYRNVVLTLLEADVRGPDAVMNDLVHTAPLHDEFVRYAGTLINMTAARAAEDNANTVHLIQRRLDVDMAASLVVIACALALAFTIANRLAARRQTLAEAVHRLSRDELEPEHYEAIARLAEKRGSRLGKLAQAMLGFREIRIAQKDNETLLKAVVEQAPCAIEVVDPVSLRFLQANAYSRQVLGYSEAELRRRGVPDIHATLGRAQLEALVQDILARRSAQFDAVHRASDGRLFDASVHVRVINLHGRDYLLGIWQDVSAERETRRKLEKFSQAIEQSPNAVLITDTEARIEYVNDAFTQTSGYTREEVLGRNPRLLKSGKTPREVYTAMWTALTRGEAWRGELVNQRKDGVEYIELAQISPIRQPDGRITHYLAIKQDITEKRRMIEELERHRHHLEQLVAERSTELLAALTPS